MKILGLLLMTLLLSEATFAKEVNDNDPLGISGNEGVKYTLKFNRTKLDGAIYRGIEVSVPFHNGTQQKPPFTRYGEEPETSCWLSIYYDSHVEFVDTNKHAELVIPSNAEFTVHYAGSLVTGPMTSSGKFALKIRAIDFDADDSQEPQEPYSGLKLERADKKVSKSIVLGISCSGADLKVKDLKDAFGTALQSISIPE